MSLRKADWADVITYFTLLSDKEKFSAKDLVDYFHFKYLCRLGIERWTSPNYRRQTSCANKLMDLYGKDLSINLVDALFKYHKTDLNRDFADMQWSLGILSSEKMGWVIEKLLVAMTREVADDKASVLRRLFTKPRQEWTLDETKLYQELLQN